MRLIDADALLASLPVAWDSAVKAIEDAPTVDVAGMSIYFCREWDETAGFYVVAPTRGRAKAAFAWETNCDYVDVRATLAVRGVNADFEKCLMDDDKDDLALMERCGLHYDYSEV